MANLYCECGERIKEITGDVDSHNGICTKCTKDTAIAVLEQAMAHIKGCAYAPRTNNCDAMELIKRVLGI